MLYDKPMAKLNFRNLETNGQSELQISVVIQKREEKVRER